MTQDVAEPSTMEPSTGACRSPITSSSVKSTAATGVLKAAASAAAAPTGISSRILFGASPRRRPSTDAIPAPTCTDGPSRPSAMPLASDAEQQPNFPSTVRKADEAVAQEQRRFGLRDAAAAGVGKKTREQITGDERAAGRNQDAPPGRASRRVHAGAQVFGDVDKCRNHQPHQRADDQREQQQDFVFVLEEGLAVCPSRQAAAPVFLRGKGKRCG